jgi:hypothetical protein
MRNVHHGVDISAHVEIGHYFNLVRVEKLYHVVGYDVRNIFMEYALVAEFIDIELEALEFNAPFIGLIADEDSGEIRESSFRAEAGKFGAGELNRVTPFLGSVGKALEFGFLNHFGSAL